MFLTTQWLAFIVLAISSSRLWRQARFDCAPTGTGLGVYPRAYPVSFDVNIVTHFDFASFLVCGQPSPVVDPTLIVGGTEAERGKYPWQIALYDAKSKILLCGGTLLNQRVVLTGKVMHQRRRTIIMS